MYNFDNRERVRKDEEKARIEEELARRRAEEAVSFARALLVAAMKLKCVTRP